MKLVGYPKENEDQIIDLLEMTLIADVQELRSLAKYLEKCAEEMEADPEGWEHSHYSDEIDFRSEGREDVIVYNPSKL